MTISRDQFDDATRLLTEGVTQQRVADKVGVSVATVSNIAIGVHAYQSMTRVKKPRRVARYKPPTPDPTPEEIEAQTREIRDAHVAAHEKKKKPPKVPCDLPTYSELAEFK